MLEVANFMTYFPVIIKTSHLKEIRDHISKVMGYNDFVDAFNEIRKSQFSQFCIMMNYLFWMHRDDYSWHIHRVNDCDNCDASGQ